MHLKERDEILRDPTWWPTELQGRKECDRVKERAICGCV